MESLEQKIRDADSLIEVLLLARLIVDGLQRSPARQELPEWVDGVPIRTSQDVRWWYEGAGHAKRRIRQSGRDVPLPLHWAYGHLRAAVIRLDRLTSEG